MTDKTKLLWHSNAAWAPTGYGVQTSLFLPELAKHYDVASSSFYGLEGARIVWNGIPVYPGLGGEYGNDYLPLHAKSHFGGDARGGMVITLLDVWVMQIAMARQLNMACIVPVDHEPAPPAVTEFLRQSQAVPLAMSRFGMDMLAGLDPIYLPHMVDTEKYRPHNQAQCREKTGVPEDAFLVGVVAANKGRPSRKGFQQMLQAFAVFRERRPNAMLYLHTTLNPNHSQGEDLNALVRGLGLPSDAVLVADQYRMALDPYSPSTMSEIFSSMDVLLNCALGEGFGIPVLEAQACGVPGIVTNFSAMPEVCKSGWHVGCRPYWTGQNSWQATPDVESIVDALNSCYRRSKAEVEHMAGEAREHALTYSVPHVMETYCLPALAELEERFGDRQPATLAAVA